MTAPRLRADHDHERHRIYRRLACRDTALARLISRYWATGPVLLGRTRDASGGDAFAELALHIVSQQISTAAALTIFGRLRGRLHGTVAPTLVLAVTIDELRATGLSGAKARSLRDLAERVLDGRLSFDRLAVNDDASAQAELEQVRGVGPWSAQLFRLHNLRRPDVFPAADTGLLRAAQSASRSRSDQWQPSSRRAPNAGGPSGPTPPPCCGGTAASTRQRGARHEPHHPRPRRLRRLVELEQGHRAVAFVTAGPRARRDHVDEQISEDAARAASSAS